MDQGVSTNLQALEQRLAQFGRFTEGPPAPRSLAGWQRRDTIGEHPVGRLLQLSLGEVLPAAKVLDWEVQPSGLVGRAAADGLVYRFRADAHAIAFRPAWDGLNEAQWQARSDGFLTARDPQHRQDFRGVRFQQKRTKRQCSRGYGCGAACIAMGKECRITPSSALSKQRLRQLQVLAREGDPRMHALAAQVQGARDQQARKIGRERRLFSMVSGSKAAAALQEKAGN